MYIRGAVSVPYLCLSPLERENLMAMIECRRHLLCTAFGTDTLPIVHRGGFLWFPWFTLTGNAEELEIYTDLIYQLCRIAQGSDKLVKEFCISLEPLLGLTLFRLELHFTGKRHIAARNRLYRVFRQTYRSVYGGLHTLF